MTDRYDVGVVGPICRDVLMLPSTAPIPQPGGVPVYAAPLYASLGLRVGVVTTLGDADAKELLAPVQIEGVSTRVVPGATAQFENHYEGGDGSQRRQVIVAEAEPLLPEHVEMLDARAVQLGPLMPTDLSPHTARALFRRVPLLALDVQGLIRAADGGPDVATLVHAGALLGHVHVAKADYEEARFLTGERDPDEQARALLRLGPDEAIVTMGGAGAVIAAGSELYRIEPIAAERIVDPTGAGDTFLAAYLSRRLLSHAPDLAGRFAAAAATLCIERMGPLAGGAADIVKRLAVT